MSEALTAIISVLVPTIGIQLGIMFFVLRRMDRMEERLVQRMDRADEDRGQIRIELRESSNRTSAELAVTRTDITALQTSIARLEGAVEVLRSLVERIAPAPR
ncbi:MAG: hypothetical protein OXD31_14355 [Chloroflexi bacterium]|nr:hypothetical protein [Chloroflexota bacterium]